MSHGGRNSAYTVTFMALAGWPRARQGRGRGQNAGVLEDVIGYLACRSCGQGLHRDGGTLRCPAGHSYDIARQGYVSMLPADAKADAGDTAAMTAARADFLGAGHFGSLATELAAAAQQVLAPQSRPGQGAGREPGAEAEP